MTVNTSAQSPFDGPGLGSRDAHRRAPVSGIQNYGQVVFEDARLFSGLELSDQLYGCFEHELSDVSDVSGLFVVHVPTIVA